jgi:hypothetical protein
MAWRKFDEAIKEFTPCLGEIHKDQKENDAAESAMENGAGLIAQIQPQASNGTK